MIALNSVKKDQRIIRTGYNVYLVNPLANPRAPGYTVNSELPDTSIARAAEMTAETICVETISREGEWGRLDVISTSFPRGCFAGNGNKEQQLQGSAAQHYS